MSVPLSVFPSLCLSVGPSVCPSVCCTLVDELVEGVLPVGAGLPPDDGAGVVVDAGALVGDVLPVGLHVPLRTQHPH